MKNRVTFLICVLLVLALLTACGQTIATPNNAASGQTIATPDDATSDSSGTAYQKITAAEGKELLESGATLTLVDVRRADEYVTAHIPSAINVPNESIESTQPDALADLNQTIIVYCRTGVRSKQAADKLVEMGYADVRDMGGIADWPYETISGAEPGEYAKPGSDSDTDPVGLMSSFSTKDLDGNDIDQSIFTEYDLTMVNVWATYCGPCISEMPELGELADEYESEGVRIVGMISDALNSDGTVSDSQLDTARSIISKTGADYLHIIPSEDLYGLMSQISVVPTTIFVDADGMQVGNVYLGSKSKAEWNEIIVHTLEELQK